MIQQAKRRASHDPERRLADLPVNAEVVDALKSLPAF
jgi:hypothetical protein